ncbi:MAG: hypothetical protein QXI12_10555 [Candidatus Methanomethyliaceae archaeon]
MRGRENNPSPGVTAETPEEGTCGRRTTGGFCSIYRVIENATGVVAVGRTTFFRQRTRTEAASNIRERREVPLDEVTRP